MSGAAGKVGSEAVDGSREQALVPSAAATSLMVLKFGGTSLGTPSRVRRAAKRVRMHVRKGMRLIVVVSATGETTNRIVRWLGSVAPARPAPAQREYDRALATGEDLSASLVASALIALGVPAVSLHGGEAGLEADGPFGAGEIRQLRCARLRALLDDGVVPVVAGFQAVRSDGETVTLGRGGSDTTAVYLAEALGAGACHIVTDVDAIYDRDPRRDPAARRLPRLSHETLVELVDAGAQVVHPTAARLAQRFRTRLHVYGFDAPVGSVGGTHVRPADDGVHEPARSEAVGASGSYEARGVLA